MILNAAKPDWNWCLYAIGSVAAAARSAGEEGASVGYVGHQVKGKWYEPLWRAQIDLGDGKVYLGFRDLMEMRTANALMDGRGQRGDEFLPRDP